MANLSGAPLIFHGNTTSTDSTAQVPVGTRAKDTSSNEWIYLLGTASTAVGTWVTYNVGSSTSALLTAGAVGPVAIAGTSTTAGLYGWYMVAGMFSNASTDTTAADKPLYIDGTDGRADDAFVAADRIHNAVSQAADTANSCKVFIQYPYVAGTANGI